MAIPIIGAVLEIINKLLDKIPIQGRKERWKNEIDNLQKEKSLMLITKADIKRAKRLRIIDDRLAYLEQLLSNSADAK